MTPDTYAFQSEHILCSSLNVKERLPRNRCDIWSLSEYRTDKYSSASQPFDNLAKWLSVRLRTKWLWVWIPLLSHIVLRLNAFAKLQNARECSPTSFFRQLPYLFICVSPIGLLNGLLLFLFRCCAEHEILWPRDRCLSSRKLTRNICRWKYSEI